MKKIIIICLSIYFSMSSLLYGQICPVDTVDAIFGPYEEVECEFYLSTRIFFIHTGTAFLTQAQADESAQITLGILNEAFNPHGIHFHGACGGGDQLANIFFIPNTADIATNSTLNDENYINIHYYGPDGGDNSGSSYDIPNNSLRLLGRDTDPGADSVYFIQSSAVVHEMGHLFGLLHPREDDCDFCTNDCYCTGDHICDTDSLSSTHVYGCEEEIDFNYMAYPTYNYCRDRFTDQQVLRMRKYLKEAEVLQGAQSKDPQVINSTTDTIISPSEGFIIKEGVDYIIDFNTQIEMFPGASIIVEGGASLEIKNGSKISGACGGMWEGIKVLGNYLQPQVLNRQGKLTVRGANTSIEDAIAAISTGEAPDGGGIVEVIGATLRNNTTGIKFNLYLIEPSLSSIQYATFTTTNNYLGEDTPTYVDIDQGSGIYFGHSNFKDERTTCNFVSDKPIGIKGFVAGGRIVDCNFENLRMGIISSKLIEEQNELEVHLNDFTKCETGALFMESDNFSLTNNTFDVMLPDSCSSDTAIGAHLLGATAGFVFKENNFSNSDIKASGVPLYASVGTKCEGTQGGIDNNITSNVYEFLNYGNEAVRMNTGGSELNPQGLLFTCNTYNDLELSSTGDIPHAIIIRSSSTIFNPQQDVIGISEDPLPTGNTFDDIFSDEDIHNDTSNTSIDYFYSEVNSNENPDAINVNTIGIPDIENTNCSSDTLCTPPCTENEIFNITNLFEEHKDIWQQLNIIIDTITNHNDSIIIQDSIRRNRMAMDRAASLMIQHYKSDTTQFQTDSVLAWLERTDSYAADYRLAKHYFFTQDSAKFTALWSTLSQAYQLSGNALSAYNGITTLFDTLQPILMSGTDLNRLPNNVISFLKNQVGRCDEADYLARVILLQNDIWLSSECGTSSSRLSASDTPPKKVKPIPVNKKDLIKVYPNPANTQIQVELIDTYASGYFNLFNGAGQRQLEHKLDGAGNISINISYLPSGIYWYRLVTAEGTEAQGKIIIQH